MRAAAALLSISLLMFGCFPHDAHKRTLAQLIEGGSLAAGIGLEAFVTTGADCDMMGIPGAPVDVNCHNRSSTWGGIGVALILGGLLGFIATISSAEDDPPEAPRVDIKAKPDSTAPTATNATPPTQPTQPTPPTPPTQPTAATAATATAPAPMAPVAPIAH